MQFCLQSSGADSQVVSFPGRVDLCQYYMVGKGKCFRKLVHECAGTGIGVRLEHTPDLTTLRGKDTPMKLYEYWLGLYPLDWEFCFMPVQTYKNFITEQYHKNPTFYNISAGSIEKVLAHIDVILSAAMEDWNNTTNHAALRCPPMIFPLPKGQDSNTAEFAIILKMDNDGDTVVYSPIPLPHLENQ